ncbi:GPI-linked NAD(P)(+)--arginine ADP-ribosyltransferase 1-like [Sardina pilchardus]|uniref:GPI-linked NAD(P)(+)--arginine ADP-ribosyltransferase 1-like n=1 Tax=Sardina pilchardus TaxID=27697 RepID=UPI002E0E3EBA
MDLAPDAVDDAYSACREQMLQKVLAKDGILQTELSKDSVFKSAWNASQGCDKTISGGQREHTQALQSFVNFRDLPKKVNKAVKTQGGNVDIYTNQFQYKSLHFLLMDAMRLLNKTECRTVFSSTFDDITAVKGADVRFGTFVSAEGDRSSAEEGCYDGGTLFNITTWSVINVESNVCRSEETTMLISPVELFKVVDVNTNTECEREIVLTSLGFKSDHDCYLFPR